MRVHRQSHRTFARGALILLREIPVRLAGGVDFQGDDRAVQDDLADLDVSREQRQETNGEPDVAHAGHDGGAPARLVGERHLFGAQAELREQHQPERPFDAQGAAGGLCRGAFDAAPIGV